MCEDKLNMLGSINNFLAVVLPKKNKIFSYSFTYSRKLLCNTVNLNFNAANLHYTFQTTYVSNLYEGKYQGNVEKNETIYYYCQLTTR